MPIATHRCNIIAAARPMRRLALLAAVALPAQAGTAFASASYSVLYSFDNAGNGGQPNQLNARQTDPTNPASWTIYGTTQYGGAGNCDGGSGCGTIFQLSTPTPGAAWQLATLYSFQGGQDGANPVAGVVFDSAGTLYGTTNFGAVRRNFSQYGTVFSLAPSSGGGWTEAVLHAFRSNPDGANPAAGLIVGANGTVYGTTYQGGKTGEGSVFAITPSTGSGVWQEKIIHKFNGNTTGGQPSAPLTADSGGALYGTASSGGKHFQGAVYRLTPLAAGGWHAALLHSFAGNSGSGLADGSSPVAGVTLDTNGAVYGTTSGGGAGFYGAVYKLTPPAPGKSVWSETILYSFTGATDGGGPAGPLIADTSGALYGMTSMGGDPSCGFGEGCGVVFKLTPPPSGHGPWSETVLHSFAGGTDGNQQGGGNGVGLIMAPSGALFGATTYGGASNAGTVFMITQ
jgi:uncharacterized repeat protein (TIGR03803 family)